MECNNIFGLLAKSQPVASAQISGREPHKDITGELCIYKFDETSVVSCVVHNLPQTKTNIFGFHIHEKGECNGDFSSAGGHYGGVLHPNHKGDMPVLFSCCGDAFLAFCTDRFEADEVIGKSVIIHSQPDDFTSQPAGNSGERIACGIIR